MKAKTNANHSSPLKDEWNEARREALNECADHLNTEWSADPILRAAGIKLGRQLRKRAEKIPAATKKNA